MLKDTKADGAWNACGFSAREQWIVYDKQGKVHQFYKPWGSPDLNINNSAGQKKLSDLLVSLQ